MTNTRPSDSVALACTRDLKCFTVTIHFRFFSETREKNALRKENKLFFEKAIMASNYRLLISSRPDFQCWAVLMNEVTGTWVQTPGKVVGRRSLRERAEHGIPHAQQRLTSASRVSDSDEGVFAELFQWRCARIITMSGRPSPQYAAGSRGPARCCSLLSTGSNMCAAAPTCARLIPAALDHVLRADPGLGADVEDAGQARVIAPGDQHAAVDQPGNACGRMSHVSRVSDKNVSAIAFLPFHMGRQCSFRAAAELFM